LAALLLLLAAAAPSLDDLFDPFSRAFPIAGKRVKLKQAAFERHLARRGPGSMLKALRRCEKAVAATRKNRDAAHKRFLKARAQYFGWMASYKKKYRRKEGRDPAHYPMPQSINRSFIDNEDAMKAAGALVQTEFFFHRWAMERLLGQAATADAKFVAAMRAEAKAKSPHQRLRAARLLALAPGADSSDLIRRESHPAVAAALAPSAADLAPTLTHEHWAARAGAIAALRKRGAAAELIARWPKESGRLRDDLHGALTGLAGTPHENWEEWWTSVPADWSPAAAVKSTDRLRVKPTPSQSGRTCFGLPTGSERFVLCLLATAAWPAMQQEVSRFLATVPENAQFAVVAYGAGAVAFKSALVANSRANRKALAKWMAARKLGGRNDLWAGIDLAFNLAEAARADTIILVNPTRPTLVGDSPALVTRPVQMHYELDYRNELLGIRILGYGTSGGGDSYYLQGLAGRFGGGFIPMPSDR
jgi:hypothetical protein